MAANRKTPNSELAEMAARTAKVNLSTSADHPTDEPLADALLAAAEDAGGGDASLYLDGSGAMSVPPGSGGGVSDGDKGDVVVSSGGTVWTIDANVVDVAKMHASATDVLFGRSTAGAGAGEEIALTSAGRALIDDANAAAQRTTLGLVAIAASGSASDLSAGTVPAARMPALTGDVTTVAGAVATTVGANKVLDTMLRQSGALAVLGRSANSTGNVADIQAVAASGAALRESGSTIGFGTLATGALADDSVTDAKLRNSAALSVIGRSANSAGDPADITASAGSGSVLRESGSTIGFGTVSTAGIGDAQITYAKFQDLDAASVFGRTAASSGVGASVDSSADGDVLRRSGTTIGWSAINDVQSFLTAGTFSGGSGWVKPTTFKAYFAESWGWGGGGQGGGGASNTGTVVRGGGAGGGGGGYARRIHLISDLGTNETVAIGGGGSSSNHGASGAAGTAGADGTASTFGTTSRMFCGGGGGGALGSNASGVAFGGGGGGSGSSGNTGSVSAGAGGGPGTSTPTGPGHVGGTGGAGGSSGGGGNAEDGGGGGGGHTSGAPTGANGGQSIRGAGGGGGGAGASSTPSVTTAGAGGSTNAYSSAAGGGGGGSAGTSGASPTGGAGSKGSDGDSSRGGQGGGGGGSSVTANTSGAAGGAGGNGGGGGGGGGSGSNTGTGGDGGAGGPGAIYVVSY